MLHEEKLNSQGSILVVGGDSAIGSHLAKALVARGSHVIQTTRRTVNVDKAKVFLDLAHPDFVFSLPNIKISCAIICAALTSTNDCAANPVLSHLINVTNTMKLAHQLKEKDVFIILLSSSAVFQGELPFLAAETKLNPANEYGTQKAEAEKRLRALGGKYAIVRMTKVLSYPTPLFSQWVRDLKQGKVIEAFSDMVMAPVSIDFVTEALVKIIDKQVEGIIQISATSDISYSDLAKKIASRFENGTQLVKVVSYRDKGIKTAALHTTLNTDVLATFGLEAPSPDDAIEDFLLRII